MTNFPVKNRVEYDLEVYPNYFLAGFYDPVEGYVQFEFHSSVKESIDPLWQYLLNVNDRGYVLAGFNSSGYDDWVLSEFILSGGDVEHAYSVNVAIIVDGVKPQYVYDRRIFSIDLMQSLKGRIGLKKVGVCMRHKRLQELPIKPGTLFNTFQRQIIFKYNRNDLDITRALGAQVEKQLQLRSMLSDLYGLDLRSKGEAAIAEAVLCEEWKKLDPSVDIKEVKSEARNKVRYAPTFYLNRPSWIEAFEQLPRGKNLQRILEHAYKMLSTPAQVYDYKLVNSSFISYVFLGDRWYKTGVGGLHSIDGPGQWVSDDEYQLIDVDVASYYPGLMLTQDLHPSAWGPVFLRVFQDLVNRRLAAKRSGDKVTADLLKIVINGTYGKTSDQFSALYDPKVTANTTISGQLSLLILAAMLEDSGVQVVSANTDGITVRVKRTEIDSLKQSVGVWESATRLEMEYVNYRSLHQLDVNNYIAVKEDGSHKGKGRFEIPELGGVDLGHTPYTQICARAVIEYVKNGTPLETTISNCTDVQEFIMTQQVKGEWRVTWDEEETGKMVRFYKSVSGHPIIRTPIGNNTGNQGRVPDSDNAGLLENLPDELPDDIDYAWYIGRAKEWLDKVTNQKRENWNKLSFMFHTHGVEPRICREKRSKAKPKSVEDFSGMLPGETLGIATGNGVMAKVVDGRAVELYHVDRPYPTKTRGKVLKDHGFELVYGWNTPADPFTSRFCSPPEDLDQYYTPAELRRVREK